MALKTSKHAIAPIQAHAGMDTTKRRKRAFGAAKVKNDAKAYIAPTCRFESGGEVKGREGKPIAHYSRHGNNNCVAYSMLVM